MIFKIGDGLACHVFLLCEIQEVRWSMDLVVKLLRVFHRQAVPHSHVVLHAHEVVVPDAAVRDHEEAKEDVAQQHLHLFCMRGQEASWVRPGVLVGLAPLEALRSDPIRGQGTTARSETAGDDNRLVSKPRLVVRQHLSVERNVLRTKVRLLIRLRVDPSERFQVAQVVMIWQLLGQSDHVVSTHLRHNHHAPDLLHLGIVWRRDSIQIRRDLCAQVADDDESLQDVFRHDVRVARLSNILAVDVQVARPEVERRCTDGPNPPLCARSKRLLLIGRTRRYNHLLSVHIRRLGGDRRDLRHLLALFLHIRDLLPLDGRWSYFHAENDVPDLALRQRGHIHVVLLAVVHQNQILQLHLHSNPLVVCETRPNVVGLCHGRLIGLQDGLRPLWIDVQRTEDQDHATERSVGRNRLEPIVVEVEQHHFRLCRLQDQIAKLLDFHARLERQ
mmetsp:Transcript_29941/g.79797  ORF Transcript_29941/g.79797 Transcript_29941/m.79797 type:complete len:445 (-) Transcript_29941:5935-7269(-)